MDLDAITATHSEEWARLSRLAARARRPRRLAAADVDELVDAYQRTATHLAQVRAAGGDPVLEARLSRLLAAARAAVTGSAPSAGAAVRTFLLDAVPATVWRVRWWWLGTTVVSVALALAVGWWVAADPAVQGAVATPDEVRQLVDRDFADYYRSAPAGSFAAKVWTNNAWVAAQAIALGVLLVPTAVVLALNVLNAGVVGGLLAAHGRLGLFFGLILPHGLLELTAVFLAGGTGLRLGWTLVAPGDRPRGQALAEEGRAAGAVAVALVAVFAVAGAIEAFVTPSRLPTAARVAVGVAALVSVAGALLARGRAAAAAGATGDLAPGLAEDRAPV